MASISLQHSIAAPNDLDRQLSAMDRGEDVAVLTIMLFLLHHNEYSAAERKHKVRVSLEEHRRNMRNLLIDSAFLAVLVSPLISMIVERQLGAIGSMIVAPFYGSSDLTKYTHGGID